MVEENGTLKLVDFDAVTDLIDCYDTPPGVGTFGYSAPEVLSQNSFHDVRADVFSLARVIIYIYNNSELPCPYEKSNMDLIDVLDCTPIMKKTLARATSIQPEKRYKTMHDFISALNDALESEKKDPPLFSVLNQEQHKVKKILTHSFWGTLIAISISRSLLAVNGSFLHLSNHWAIALMHGFFGSLFWGILIPFAFLCYFVKFPHKNSIWFYMTVMFVCAFSAGLGGMICAYLSTSVTNAITLQFFGWIPEQIKGFEGISHTTQTITETRMFWVYPIIGFCTGAGVGLFLNFKTNELLNGKVKGITPIPMKDTELDKKPFLSTIKFIFSSPTHLFLFFPIVFPSLLQSIINLINPNEYLLFKPSSHLYDKVYSDPFNVPMKYQDVTVPKLWKGLVESGHDFFIYQEFWRIIGEGFIQYCGSVGLLIGFFWGVSKYATKESKI